MHLINPKRLPLLPSGPDGVGRGVTAQGLTLITKGEAEREGFEPSVLVRAHTLSKRAPSATRSSLLAPIFISRGIGTSHTSYGERGIRTLGGRKGPQRFSRPPDSTALASLPFFLLADTLRISPMIILIHFLCRRQDAPQECSAFLCRRQDAPRCHHIIGS